MIHRARRFWMAALLALVSAGCGSGLDLAPVTGRVTMNGQPVPQGQISFVPENGPPAIGSIAADGTYRLSTLQEDGALVGRHKVTIMATKVSGGSAAPATFEQELEWAKKGVQSSGKITIPGEVTWLVPEKFSRTQTTDLTAEVKPQENEINFDLKDGT